MFSFLRGKFKTASAFKLLDYRRFDIPAKILALRFAEEKIASSWGEQVYKNHLFVWNGFFENSPRKTNYQEFLHSFMKVSRDIRNDKFDFKQSPLIVTAKGQLFNGSHRLASAIFYNKPVRYLLDKTKNIDPYDYRFFQNRIDHNNRGLEEKYSDAIALEYIRVKQRDLYLLILFPVADSLYEQAEGVIRSYAEVVYYKAVRIELSARFRFIKQVYAGEPWNTDATFSNVEAKANSCFSKTGRVQVYLLESPHLEAIVECKTKLRELYQLGKHSVHTTGNFKDTDMLAKLFFNTNSLHCLNKAIQNTLPSNLRRLLDIYRKGIETLGLDVDYLCIDSSAVLALYGLRDARDLDYLHIKYGKDELSFKSKEISSHNEHVGKWLDQTIDEIVADPQYHLYFEGLKFATLDVVKAMKSNRREGKDFDDIALISTIK